MKKINLDQDKLLGFKILPKTPKVGSKPERGKTLMAKVGLKLGGKIGGKIGSKF